MAWLCAHKLTNMRSVDVKTRQDMRSTYRALFLPVFPCLRFHRRVVATSTVLCALPHYKIARKDIEIAIQEGNRFPWKDAFELSKGVEVDSDTIIRTLSPMLTEERIRRMQHVAAHRTFNVLPVLEHPYDLGNIAAVCRSADALGFGAVHVIRNVDDTRYKQSTRTSGGADKWLDLQLFNSAEDCLDRAKRLGFQIVATHLRADSVAPADIDWTRPTAIVFGNELQGLAPKTLEMADACTALPMDGFVESFNVSVAAALMLWEARRVRLEKLGSHGDLSQDEQRILLAAMFLRSKGLAAQYASHLLRKPPPEWQLHRGGGFWAGKTFAGVDQEGMEALQRRRCHYWDGQKCYGEHLGVFEGGCRYKKCHVPGVSTLNKGKLQVLCDKTGLPMPDLASDKDLQHAHKDMPKAGDGDEGLDRLYASGWLEGDADAALAVERLQAVVTSKTHPKV